METSLNSKFCIDQTWLKILNKERKKENLGQVSNFLFEAIIDSLEKEWFNLVKRENCMLLCYQH